MSVVVEVLASVFFAAQLGRFGHWVYNRRFNAEVKALKEDVANLERNNATMLDNAEGRRMEIDTLRRNVDAERRNFDNERARADYWCTKAKELGLTAQQLTAKLLPVIEVNPAKKEKRK